MAGALPARHSHFPSFTRTKVQALTPEELLQGRQHLPEKGSIVYQEWTAAGQGGGGGGGGPSGNVAAARERAQAEEEEALGESSALVLALGVLEKMCGGGHEALQVTYADVCWRMLTYADVS